MLKTVYQFFFPPTRSNKCPYCSLDWRYNEAFRFIRKRCVFKHHSGVSLRPNSFDVGEAHDLLEENGFKVTESLFEHGHYVILLGGKD